MLRHWLSTPLNRHQQPPTGLVRATAGAGAVPVPKSPGVATPGMLREVLRKLRGDMMDAEAHVPWSAVRSGICDQIILRDAAHVMGSAGGG